MSSGDCLVTKLVTTRCRDVCGCSRAGGSGEIAYRLQTSKSDGRRVADFDLGAPVRRRAAQTSPGFRASTGRVSNTFAMSQISPARNVTSSMAWRELRRPPGWSSSTGIPLRIHEIAAANRGTPFFGDFLWGSKESHWPRGHPPAMGDAVALDAPTTPPAARAPLRRQKGNVWGP